MLQGSLRNQRFSHMQTIGQSTQFSLYNVNIIYGIIYQTYRVIFITRPKLSLNHQQTYRYKRFGHFSDSHVLIADKTATQRVSF